MIVCEQTRLRVVVLVECFIIVSLGQAVLRSAKSSLVLRTPKTCLRHSEQWPRFARNSMLCGSSSQWSGGCNASRIVFYSLVTSTRRHRYLHRE